MHLALQELIAREVPAAKEVALTVGKFAGGLAANVIPDTCVLEGTLRGFDVELMEHLKTRIAEVVNGVATTYRTPATIETLSDVPPLVLDSDMTQASLGYVAQCCPSRLSCRFSMPWRVRTSRLSRARFRVRTLPWARP